MNWYNIGTYYADLYLQIFYNQVITSLSQYFFLHFLLHFHWFFSITGIFFVCVSMLVDSSQLNKIETEKPFLILICQWPKFITWTIRRRRKIAIDLKLFFFKLFTYHYLLLQLISVFFFISMCILYAFIIYAYFKII